VFLVLRTVPNQLRIAIRVLWFYNNFDYYEYFCYCSNYGFCGDFYFNVYSGFYGGVGNYQAIQGLLNIKVEKDAKKY
jgi:hypothetical protein